MYLDNVINGSKYAIKNTKKNSNFYLFIYLKCLAYGRTIAYIVQFRGVFQNGLKQIHFFETTYFLFILLHQTYQMFCKRFFFIMASIIFFNSRFFKCAPFLTIFFSSDGQSLLYFIIILGIKNIFDRKLCIFRKSIQCSC